MSKNVKSVLSEAVSKRSRVTFSYTDLAGKTSTRTVRPEEFVSGLHGESVVAVDESDSGRRRFLVNNISMD